MTPELARERLDALAKPPGSLGRFGDLAARLCATQRTLTPRTTPRWVVQFAADQGVVAEGVSAWPAEVSHKVGDALKVRVLFGGKPLADANLGWDHPGDDPDPAGTARTDARGEAMAPVARTRLMTVRLTHMTRPEAKEYE